MTKFPFLQKIVPKNHSAMHKKSLTSRRGGTKVERLVFTGTRQFKGGFYRVNQPNKQGRVCVIAEGQVLKGTWGGNCDRWEGLRLGESSPCHS